MGAVCHKVQVTLRQQPRSQDCRMTDRRSLPSRTRTRLQTHMVAAGCLRVPRKTYLSDRAGCVHINRRATRTIAVVKARGAVPHCAPLQSSRGYPYFLSQLGWRQYECFPDIVKKTRRKAKKLSQRTVRTPEINIEKELVAASVLKYCPCR